MLNFITGILLISLSVLLALLPFVIIAIALGTAVRRLTKTPKKQQRTRSLLLLAIIALAAAAFFGVWFELHVSL